MEKSSPIFLSLFISGCIPLPPSEKLPPKSELLEVSGKGCVVTIARTSGFAGGVRSIYVTFDSGLVAELTGGEYTRFSVPKGNHSVGILIRDWGFIAFGIYTGGGEKGRQYGWVRYVECQPGKTFFFGIPYSIFSGWDLIEVTDSDKDFQLEGKTLVPAGIPKKQ
jgi:hypothetical protein